MMIAQETHSTQENQLTAVYKIPATLDNSRIWTLEYNLAYSYGIRSLNKPTHLMQTRDKAPWRIQGAWEMAQSNWTQWDFAYESENKTWTDTK